MKLEDELRAAMGRRLDAVSAYAPDDTDLAPRFARERRNQISKRIAVGAMVLATMVGTVSVAGLLESPSNSDDGFAEPGPREIPAWVPPSPLPKGLRVRVVAPESVVAGELFEMRVRISDDSGTLEGTNVLFDNGGGQGGLPADFDCGDPEREPKAIPDAEEVTYFHAFRTAGTQNVRVNAQSGGCGVEDEFVSTEVIIEVTPSSEPVMSNGPQQPNLWIEHSFYEGRTEVGVTALDTDGFVWMFEFDWGDGSEPTVIREDLAGCVESPDRWPDTHVSQGASHRHQPGAYTITVRAVSVGCDGEEPQEATAVTRITVGD